MPTSFSLLRYPGGKTYLAPLLKKVLEANDMTGCTYAEPFAGSAGAALRLLLEGHVSSIVLGDIDPVVCAFWRIILTGPELLVSFIESVPLNIDEWNNQRTLYFNVEANLEKRALAFFYLNRTNRSGVLFAGPIGGKKQDGKYRLDARFNRQALVARIRVIETVAGSISFHRLNAVAMCRQLAQRAGTAKERIFVYLDPPYYEWGPELYVSTFSHRQHLSLARRLGQLTHLRWLLSSDCDPRAVKTYGAYNQTRMTMNYSIHQHRKATELLVWPRHLVMPDPKCLLNLNHPMKRCIDDAAEAQAMAPFLSSVVSKI